MHDYADVSSRDRVRLSTEGSILSPRVSVEVNLVQPKWFGLPASRSFYGA